MDTDAILGLLKETAAEVITPRFRALRDGDVEEKGPGDLVTIADREAEAHLTARLSGTFPHAVVIGEEAVAAQPGLLHGLRNAEHVFIIDPIDGTRNFVRGREEHGIMLAEVRAGLTTRGWIWQPQTGDAYIAERGAGVCLNGSRVERQAPSRPPLGASSRQYLWGFSAEGRLSPVVSTRFCCAFDYPSLLHGDIDFLFYATPKPWDHLAGSLMVTEQGGLSRTIDGLAYTLASSPRGLLVAGDPLSWMTAQQHWPST